MQKQTPFQFDNYSESFNHLFEGVLIVNAEGEINYANIEAARILGFQNPNEIKNLKFTSFLHDLYKVQFSEIIGEIVSGKTKKFEKEIIVKIKENDLVPCRCKVLVFNNKEAIVYLYNISIEKLIEERLFEVTEQINAIIKTAVDGIITITSKGIIETVNPAASKLFGYQPEELIGKNIKVLMPEPDRGKHDGYIKNYEETRQPKIIGIGREVTALKKNGEKFPISLGVSEVKLTKRVIYTGIIHDLTQQKLIEEQLRRVAEDLKRSNRELEDFAYVSSHDLQEPLRKIQAFGDRIRSKDWHQLSEKSQDYFDRMMKASQRMQNLINDLLSFSRISSRAKPFISVNLNDVIHDVLVDLELSIEKSKTNFKIESLPTLEADPTQMRQLFQNLISNAIKFSAQKNNPTVEIWSEKIQLKPHLNATPGDQFLQIHVKDNGIGFNEQFSDKIFNIFSRLEGKKFEGSGIGLSICKKIVNRHGGDITVKSTEGEGTEFIIKLATQQTHL